MKLKHEELERLADTLLANYHSKELIVPKTSDLELKDAIVAIIDRNFTEEEAIEQEARTMLASYAQTARDVDPFKMFLLAKQKIAAKKGFIL